MKERNIFAFFLHKRQPLKLYFTNFVLDIKILNRAKLQPMFLFVCILSDCRQFVNEFSRN